MSRVCTIVLCFLASICFAQKDSAFLLMQTYRGDIAMAAVDNLDNVYVVSSTGQLKKLNGRGDSVGVFNGIRAYGKLSAIDVTNPLKPILFYKDFSTVVVLDRLLTSRASLDLRKYGVLQPTAVALSYDNNIWVYDQYENKLKKLDEAGNTLLETTDFRQLFNQSISPQKIINDNGLVYLADSAQGVFVFDNYGTFKRKIDVKNWTQMDVQNGRLVRLGKNEILVYNPATFIEQSKAFPPHFAPYAHAYTAYNKLVTFSQDTLQIYRFAY